MTDNPPLAIPDEAVAAYLTALAAESQITETLRAAAAPIVTAELHRLAAEFDDMAEHWENAGDQARASVYTMEKSNLHKRATQFDGGTP